MTPRWPVRFNPRDPRLSVSVVFVAVMFMTIMDATVVNVALPTLRHQFGVSAAAVSAVVTSYLVAVAVVMPASGWLGDRVGGKRLLLGALASFTVASAACGQAASLPALVAFPEAVGGMIGIQTASRLYPRTGPRRLMAAGLLAAAVPITAMSTLGPGNASWAMPGLMFVTGLLFGFSAGPAQTASLATISMAQTGQAMTLFNVQRQAGQAMGVAVLATVLAATRPVPRDLLGYHLAFVVAAIAMACGSVIASRVRDADAAAMMAAALS